MGTEWSASLAERGMHTLAGCRVTWKVSRERGAHSIWVQRGLQAWWEEVCILWMGSEWSVKLAERGAHTLDGCGVVCKLGRDRYAHSRWVQSGLCNLQREGCTH
jgi:hypothetical protein